MTEIREHVWQSIQDLPEDWPSLKDTELHSLMTAWQQQAERVRHAKSYNEFLLRLRREWAIETGQIERLYDICEGATKTLIEQGLDASLLSHEDTTLHPENVIAHIKDQYTALEGLYQFVAAERSLGTSDIKELHRVLTAHQTQYLARDALGNSVLRELPRGTWKTMPNNVELEGGKFFEFCPSEHVAAEMDQLIAWHQEHEQRKIPPEIESAWLHHRFTLIHPFTDGNGRVARCLATLVLLKHRWFPLVVTRGDRADYLSAIRQADQDDMGPLVRLFGQLQKRAIKHAMSLGEEIERGPAAIPTILGRVQEKLQHDRIAELQLQKRVFSYANSLWDLAREKLGTIEGQISGLLADQKDAGYRADTDAAGQGMDRCEYFRYQIVRCATELGYFANPDNYRAWSRLVVVTETRVEILFSFHGIGREFNGVLVCSGMAYTKRQIEDASEITDLTTLSKEPFYFAAGESLSQVHDRFDKWIDQALVEGLDYWRTIIGA